MSAARLERARQLPERQRVRTAPQPRLIGAPRAPSGDPLPRRGPRQHRRRHNRPPAPTHPPLRPCANVGVGSSSAPPSHSRSSSVSFIRTLVEGARAQAFSRSSRACALSRHSRTRAWQRLARSSLSGFALKRRAHLLAHMSQITSAPGQHAVACRSSALGGPAMLVRCRRDPGNSSWLCQQLAAPVFTRADVPAWPSCSSSGHLAQDLTSALPPQPQKFVMASGAGACCHECGSLVVPAVMVMLVMHAVKSPIDGRGARSYAFAWLIGKLPGTSTAVHQSFHCLDHLKIHTVPTCHV